MLTDEMVKLKDSLSCTTANGAQYDHIQIKEADETATLKTVTLKVGQGDWFSFSPDEGRKCKRIHPGCHAVVMSPLLTMSHAHDHHRACDCVVVINSGGQLTLVYIELKSGNPVSFQGQFKSTRQFVRYALGLLEEFHQKKLEIAEERYVVLFGGKPRLINKTPSIAKFKKITKSKPGAALKREVSNAARLYLKELLG
jgi:hypothetical protein